MIDSENLVRLIEVVGRLIETAGVAVIVVGSIAATFGFVRDQVRGTASAAGRFGAYRRGLGRAILLGLEFLVAGDIIRTVAVEPTFQSVGVLAIIVLIRTFLSFTLELETEGRWPWQPEPSPASPSPTPSRPPGAGN